jgi:hypothetical protein
MILMAIGMLLAVAGVGCVAWLLARAAVEEERVSDAWIGSHIRDRRDDV